jgi:hypothetical protein
MIVSERRRRRWQPTKISLAFLISVFLVGVVGALPAFAAGPPGAPTNVRATGGPAGPGGGEATITWNTPALDGGSPIVKYKIEALIGTTVSKTVEVLDGKLVGYTMKGLATTATTYTFKVYAGNATGPSGTVAYGPAGTSNAVTVPAAGVSDPPTNVTAMPGSQSATVSWGAPVNTGAGPITGYRVDIAGYNPADPCGAHDRTYMLGPEARGLVVTQLQGTTYQFCVFALNAYGESLPGSATATPVATAPGTPTRVLGTRGDRQVQLTWDPPVDNGGSPITDYRIVALATGSGTTSTYFIPTLGDETFSRATITGLTNGTTYTFDVSAGNKTGPGGATAYGNPGTSNPVTPATIPGAPTNVQAVPRHQSAIISWTLPASNGGDELTANKISVSPFVIGAPFTASGSDTSFNVTGLTNGTAYTFTVWSVNTVGPGPASAPVTATPLMTVADAPSPVTAVRANQQVTVGWTIPLYDGGQPIDNFKIEVMTGTTVVRTETALCGAPPCTVNSKVITALNNGTLYTFRVSAHNFLGYGPTASANATPATQPDAPILRNNSTPVSPDVNGVELGDGMVTLRWQAYPNPIVCNPTPPAPQTLAECHPTGGEVVSGFDIETLLGPAFTTVVSGLTYTQTTAAGPDAPRATVAGLTNGTEYKLRIRAKNGTGAGLWTTTESFRTGPRIRFTTELGAPLSSIAFGNVLVGQSSDPVTVVVYNWGSSDLVIDSGLVTSSKPGANYSMVLDNCSGNTIFAKTSCQFQLTFTPVQRDGITGTFSLASNSIDASPVISLSGTGVGPIIGYSPASIAFGNQAVDTLSDLRTVTITNSGNRDLYINSVSIDGFGAPNFLIDQVYDLCTGALVAPNASCTVGIRFAPIRAGATSATVKVEHDAFVDPAKVTLSGTGT